MSVAVSLDRLREEVARFGASPYLLSVTSDGRPHAVAVAVSWQGDALEAGAGTRTVANIAERPAVTLLWPAVEPGGYSLIVDGVATAAGAGSGERLSVQPAKAVLHRRRPDGAGSDCVGVLPG